MTTSPISRISDDSFGVVKEEINTWYGFAKESPLRKTEVIAVWACMKEDATLNDSAIATILEMDEREVHVVMSEIRRHGLIGKVTVQ